MNNVNQITHLDLINAPEVIRQIKNPNGNGEIISYPYKVISKKTLEHHVFKFGYCPEPKGAYYPIFLTINGLEKKFELSTQGMFEFQPEQWKTLTNESKETLIKVTEIKVPKNIQFILDYCYAV